MEHTSNTPQGKVTIKYSANNPFLMGLESDVKNHRSKGMDKKVIPEAELSTVYIGDTGVTVLDVICALCDVLDGEHAYDIHRSTEHPLERCREIIKTRDSVQPIWLKLP